MREGNLLLISVFSAILFRGGKGGGVFATARICVGEREREREQEREREKGRERECCCCRLGETERGKICLH